MLQFSYTAMSDGMEKTATFPKNTISGWSLTELPQLKKEILNGQTVPMGKSR